MDKLKSKIGYVGGLSSFVDIPDQVFKEHKVGLTKTQEIKQHELRLLYPDPLVQVGKRHQLEQGIFEGEIIFSVVPSKASHILYGIPTSLQEI
jgi:hypothetical protein